MKKLVFPLIMVVLLAVAGLGGAGRFGYGPLAPYLHKEVPVVQEPPQIKRRTIALGEIVTPIIVDHEIQRQVDMDLAMEIDDAVADKAQARLTPLLDAMHLALLDFIPTHGDVRSPADKQAVHDRLLAVARDVLGGDGNIDIKVKSFYQR